MASALVIGTYLSLRESGKNFTNGPESLSNATIRNLVCLDRWVIAILLALWTQIHRGMSTQVRLTPLPRASKRTLPEGMPRWRQRCRKFRQAWRRLRAGAPCRGSIRDYHIQVMQLHQPTLAVCTQPTKAKRLIAILDPTGRKGGREDVHAAMIAIAVCRQGTTHSLTNRRVTPWTWKMRTSHLPPLGNAKPPKQS